MAPCFFSKCVYTIYKAMLYYNSSSENLCLIPFAAVLVPMTSGSNHQTLSDSSRAAAEQPGKLTFTLTICKVESLEKYHGSLSMPIYLITLFCAETQVN